MISFSNDAGEVSRTLANKASRNNSFSAPRSRLELLLRRAGYDCLWHRTDGPDRLLLCLCPSHEALERGKLLQELRG